MRMLVLLLLIGCADVASEHQCRTDLDCGSNGRCEESKNCSFPDATCGSNGFRYHERAGEARAGICVLSMETPTAALAPVDLEATKDTLINGCGPAGARVATFEVHGDEDQVVIFDTAATGTTGPVLMSMHRGSCPPSGDRIGNLCATSACSIEEFVRFPIIVPSGNHCLVVEEKQPQTVATSVGLRVFPSHRSSVADFVPGVPIGPLNSCFNQSNAAMPSCGQSNVPETTFVVALCPGQTATLGVMVNSSSFPVITSLHEAVPQASSPICANTPGPGPESFSQNIGGPTPYWIVVEGVDPVPCGEFTATINLTNVTGS